MAGAEFGLWIRNERRRRRLTQTGLARLTGLSAGYISMLENGAVHTATHKEVRPKLDVVIKVADALEADRQTVRLIAGYAPTDESGLVAQANNHLGMVVSEVDEIGGSVDEISLPVTREEFRRLEALLQRLLDGDGCPLRQLTLRVPENMEPERRAA